MQLGNDARAKLTFFQANTICRGFIPIADRAFECMDRLCEARFAAFMPRNEFVESFATSTEEFNIHRPGVVDIA
jgi:hypothetical protein